jgi:5'-3' exonuclease/transcription antitermination factor NusG
VSAPNDQWVILALSSKADGEDPDLVRRSIAYAVRGAEVFIPAAITQVGEDRVIHYLVEGYAFIRHQHPDNAYNRLENSKYVAGVITKIVRLTGQRPTRQLAFVTTADIEKMRRQIHVETDQGIGVGDTVLITSGAYKQITAKVIEEIGEEDKVQVHIQLRSKDTIISLPRSFLQLKEKAPKPPALDQFMTLCDWFNNAHSAMHSASLVSIQPVHAAWEAFNTFSSWSGTISTFQELHFITNSPPLTLGPVREKHSLYVQLNEWAYEVVPRMSIIRSFYTPLDVTPIKAMGDATLRLTGWADRWQQLVPYVQLGSLPVPTTEPVERKYLEWMTIRDFQDALDSMVDDLDFIESELREDGEDVLVNNVIVDGFNLAYRCFYAPGMGDMRDTQGRHSGVLYGFVRSITSLKKRFPNAQLFVAWDGSNRTRKAKFADYKANRTNSGFAEGQDAKGDRWDQIDWLRQFLPLLGVTQVLNEGEEADDAIAALVKGRLKGQENIILSSDRDLLQLITETDRLLTPAQGKRKETLYDINALKEEWGVGPDQIVTLRALLGDSSDNIPGVPTVPQKVLTGLVQLYGTIDGIFSSNLAGLTKLRYECLRTAESQVRLNLDLMTLREVPLAEVAPNPDQTAAEEWLTDVDVQPESILTAFFGERAEETAVTA